ncbi:MAG TPA: hypothetical protein VEA37_03870, partial [Flavobacterium sp.]|nr:hypothetical protein [Flavobacterium sp.]
MPQKNRPKKSQDILIPTLKDIWQNTSSGRALIDKNGKLLFWNQAAKSFCKNSLIKKELFKSAYMTTHQRDELVGDYPTKDRIIRIHTKYMKNESGYSYVNAHIEDVTDEWVEERQKEILEHIASISAQSIPTTYWLQSLLNKIVVLK